MSKVWFAIGLQRYGRSSSSIWCIKCLARYNVRYDDELRPRPQALNRGILTPSLWMSLNKPFRRIAPTDPCSQVVDCHWMGLWERLRVYIQTDVLMVLNLLENPALRHPKKFKISRDRRDQYFHRNSWTRMVMSPRKSEHQQKREKRIYAAPVNLSIITLVIFTCRIFIGNAWTGRATDSAAVNGSQAAQAQAQETYWDFKLDSRTCHTSRKMWRLQWQSEGAMN
ncbi:hypothetical protein BDZ97DRAFT_1763731 [Flammula alnicola]|nr:hypothetical protein BDZ97DRAFT_1763731 [Flammula alnicola]